MRGQGYETWPARQSTVDPDPPIDPDDHFIIGNTGGATGKSKGVAYTHHAWLAGGRNVMATKFDPATLPDLMIKERAAYMFMVRRS